MTLTGTSIELVGYELVYCKTIQLYQSICWKIKRPLLHFYQRRTRGWDDSEIWSLDYTFAEWILPRLTKLRDIKKDRFIASCFFRGEGRGPHGNADEKQTQQASDRQHKIYTEMIEGFQLLVDSKEHDPASAKKITRAFDLFSKYSGTLWW